jgi:hypothetical protein
MDDCLRAFSSPLAASHFIATIKQALASYGFPITKWTSNDEEVMASVPIEERASEHHSLDLDIASSSCERALGVTWMTGTDTLGMQVGSSVCPETKRGVLKILSSVFDPLGIVSPFVLKAKLVFQGECRMRKGWDDPLEPENQQLWNV